MLHHTTPAPASPPRAPTVQIRSQRRAHWAWFDHALIDDHAHQIRADRRRAVRRARPATPTTIRGNVGPRWCV